MGRLLDFPSSAQKPNVHINVINSVFSINHLGSVSVHRGVASHTVDLFAIITQPPRRVPSAFHAYHHQSRPPVSQVVQRCLNESEWKQVFFVFFITNGWVVIKLFLLLNLDPRPHRRTPPPQVPPLLHPSSFLGTLQFVL